MRLKPAGAVSNVFYLTGLNPYVDGVYIYDTATSYTGSTCAIYDSTNKRARIRNVTVEKGYFALDCGGASYLENCDVLASVNTPAFIVDGRYIPRSAAKSLRIINGLMRVQYGYPIGNGNGFDTGTYVVGDLVENNNPVENGIAGSKYISSGWVVVTAGAANIANMRGLRCLTGN